LGDDQDDLSKPTVYHNPLADAAPSRHLIAHNERNGRFVLGFVSGYGGFVIVRAEFEFHINITVDLTGRELAHSAHAALVRGFS
jgi:hypothetical protein